MTEEYQCPKCSGRGMVVKEYGLAQCPQCNGFGHTAFKSVAIQRLIDEVKAGDTQPSGYNRTYSRHNRS